MVSTVIVEEGQCHQQASVAPPRSVIPGQAEYTVSCRGPGVTAGMWTLRCHEILVVEKAEERGGEEAGGDPPREEGEEAPEEQGGEDSPQASQSHRELGHRHPGLCDWSWGRPRTQ